nr:uncharacterized protein LOC121125436 [Lepeophtheirus salmonis]XP_040576570.1 uncharacterized protein LOC121125436 [Lepeophtheirus salmonis]
MESRNKTWVCAVAICGSPNNVVYHDFPKDCLRRKIWERACHRKGRLGKTPRICENHFEENNYERDLRNELLGLPLRRKLKSDAIPTKNLVPGEKPLPTPNEREQREAKKKRMDFVDSILKAYEENPPIPNYFAPTVAPDIVEFKFVEASIQTPFKLDDTSSCRKVKKYNSSTQTFTAKPTDSYNQVCGSQTLKQNLNKIGESKSSRLKIKMFKHGFERSRESEEARNPHLEENIQLQSEYRDQESKETKNQYLEEDILYLDSSVYDSDETQICQIFVKGHL